MLAPVHRKKKMIAIFIEAHRTHQHSNLPAHSFLTTHYLCSHPIFPLHHFTYLCFLQHNLNSLSPYFCGGCYNNSYPSSPYFPNSIVCLPNYFSPVRSVKCLQVLCSVRSPYQFSMSPTRNAQKFKQIRGTLKFTYA